jgi:molybdopterin/thiamine biosynthesis adenylyltransferase
MQTTTNKSSGQRKEKGKEPRESAEVRFKDTVPLQKFNSRTIGIAGLGATGAQVARILAVMGHRGMWGADPDTIELKNVGTQGWSTGDIGAYKASVLRNSLSTRRSKFTGVEFKFEEYFQLVARAQIPMALKTDIFFCCVDTMRARETIWDTLKERRLLQGPKIWIDSRLASRVIRIIKIPLDTQIHRDYYESTLYSDTEAFQGACTDRMTYYGAGIAAGLMVSQLVNWLNYESVASMDFVLETVSMGVKRIK